MTVTLMPRRVGTTEELTRLFRVAIHPGAVTDDGAFTHLGYWTQEKVDEARQIVRAEAIATETAGAHA